MLNPAGRARTLSAGFPLKAKGLLVLALPLASVFVFALLYKPIPQGSRS